MGKLQFSYISNFLLWKNRIFRELKVSSIQNKKDCLGAAIFAQITSVSQAAFSDKFSQNLILSHVQTVHYLFLTVSLFIILRQRKKKKEIQCRWQNIVGSRLPQNFQLIESKLNTFKVIGNGRQLFSYGHEKFIIPTEQKPNLIIVFCFTFDLKHTNTI